MILYLDTSALVKLYVAEAGSDIAHKAVANCRIAATSKVAYAEARAAFARAHREQAIDDEEYKRIIAIFRADWDSYLTISISDQLIYLAGDLAEFYRLRGFDAIHLASLITLQHQLQKDIIAVCWDVRLWQAMREHGFSMIPQSLSD